LQLSAWVITENFHPWGGGHHQKQVFSGVPWLRV
jgi:hypothetical protein